MFCFLFVLAVIRFGYVNSQDQCRTANGDAGSCILLENCDPLLKISEDDDPTEGDLTFLSRSSCGLHLHIKPKVCCPPKEQWTGFTTARPITFPAGIITAPTTKPPRTTTRIPRPPPGSTIDKTWTCPPTIKPPNPDSFCCGIDASTSERIAGGKEAAVEQYPWLALLEYEKTSRTHCGGSLISSRYVLTAAHCLGKTIYGEPTNVRLSEYNTSSYPTDTVEVSGEGLVVVTVLIIKIEKQIPHPEYDRRSKGHYNDIGLIKLQAEAPYNNFIRPICLPVSEVTQYQEVDIHLIAAGWGSTGWGSNGNEPSEIKLQVSLPFVPLDKCQSPYTKKFGTVLLKDTQICAGGQKGKDSCGGDSGGPLMYQSGNTYVLQGIVSFGPVSCGTEGTPGIYTNVHKYLNWIDREIS